MHRFKDGRLTTFPVPGRHGDGLPAGHVTALGEDQVGALWVGMDEGAVCYFKDGRFRTVQSFADHQIKAIYADREGNLWVGTYQHGLYRLRPELITFYSQQQGMAGNGASPIFEDRAGQVWIGAGGLNKFKDGIFSHHAVPETLFRGEVTSLSEDREGRLWFATYGGLSRFAEGRFISFTEPDGLASNRVRTLYEDDAGVLWIGSYDGGLTRLKDGRFTRYTTREGLFNNGVFRILEDGRGNFWMSCNRGIYRVSRQQLNDFAEGKIQVITSVSYDKQDGLANTECNGGQQPAGWKTRDGKLWFPTQGGVAVIDPQAVALNPQPPPVVIESGIIDRASVDLRSPLKLFPGQENLELHYTGLSFIKSEYVRFKYQVVGLDQDWVDVGPRRVAYFNHLSPGTILSA